MKRRTVIRIISFLSATALVFGGFAVKAEMKSNKYKLEIENSYSKCIDDLSTGLNNISLTLKKAQYVSTPKQVSSMAAQLLSQAESSKNALSQLPQNGELTSVNKFLSQVGNYAMAVSKKLITTGNVTDKDIESISTLSETAGKVAQIINETEVSYADASKWADTIERQVDSATEANNLNSMFSEIEDSFDDYPTLVYDGPYSDHILEKEPLMLKNAKSVSEREAMKTAAKIADTEESALKSDGRIFGNLPAFRFSGEGVTATVSVSGGYPIYMRKERVVSDSILTYEQALEKAKRYLINIGLQSFTETYYFTSEGVCVINFAYLDGETVCYTDLVKVGVAMDNGEIMFFEGSGYLSNHTDRAFETPAYTAEKAKGVLSENLTLQKTSLTLIPLSGDEKRCYEFACVAADNTEVLVYIDTQTLEEQEVLILLKSDGGTLVK